MKKFSKLIVSLLLLIIMVVPVMLFSGCDTPGLDTGYTLEISGLTTVTEGASESLALKDLKITIVDCENAEDIGKIFTYENSGKETNNPYYTITVQNFSSTMTITSQTINQESEMRTLTIILTIGKNNKFSSANFEKVRTYKTQYTYSIVRAS